MLHANISNERENDATYHQYIHSYQRMIMSAYEINMYLPCCLTHSTYSAIMLCIIKCYVLLICAAQLGVLLISLYHLNQHIIWIGGAEEWRNGVTHTYPFVLHIVLN